ncbi:hypothetical protein ACWGH4_03560 [Streptomyces sp. NPDC054847]
MKIDALLELRIIHKNVRDAAHEERFGGNEDAHDLLVVEPIDVAAADETLGLMDEVLEEVYQSPARVAQRQQRFEREQRRRKGDETTPTDSASPPASEAVDDAPPF